MVHWKGRLRMIERQTGACNLVIVGRMNEMETPFRIAIIAKPFAE
jgi:hypothetical protein